jgi:hypothetical protein
VADDRDDRQHDDQCDEPLEHPQHRRTAGAGPEACEAEPTDLQADQRRHRQHDAPTQGEMPGERIENLR